MHINLRTNLILASIFLASCSDKPVEVKNESKNVELTIENSLECLIEKRTIFTIAEFVEAMNNVLNPNNVKSNGDCIGPLQISKAALGDVNTYLDSINVDKKFTVKDCEDLKSSTEIMFLYVKRWESDYRKNYIGLKELTFEDIAKIHFGGGRYYRSKNRKNIDKFWHAVKSEMYSIKIDKQL